MKERIGAVILLRGDGAALLQLRDCKEELRNAGMWVPPGGHAEPSETIETCAHREFLEETDYNCSKLQLLTDFEDCVEGWPSYQITVFWACFDGIQKTRCNEGQALEFIRREDASSYSIPSYLMNIWDMAISAAKRKGVIQ
jgi:8-oxo-dGTP pyrophosphatase MutT (NUDIX family)